ncbi:MAG TPA: DUF1707 domain-containing protein [Streptosporangiaceae bacterium]|nr:DUF1707 domain-containing protein [Streptosporangiaceae bacterium]
MPIRPGYGMAAGSYACMRASTADRDRAIEILKGSFVEGRLTREEFGQRVGQVFVSRTFAELMALTADLPVGPFGRLPAHPATPALPRTNRLAVVALVCALAGPFSAGITAVPGIWRAVGSAGPASGELPSRRRRWCSAGSQC